MKRLKFIAIFLATLFIASCSEEFFDINQDPNNPSDAKSDMLLTAIESDVAYTYSPYLDQALLVYSHQLTTREDHDKYGLNGDSYALNASWNVLYGILPEIDYLIDQAAAEGDTKYAGVAKLIKAYVFSKAVDVWGDIPFSEANKFDEGIQFPLWDDDLSVYDQIFSLIDEAKADINNTTATNYLEMGDDDLIYGGDMDKWVRMANTLKLKMYNQMRLYTDVSADASALLSEDKLIEEGGDFEFWFNESNAPDQRHPYFSGEYGGSQTSLYISPWFYETMIGDNPYAFTGVADPRVPYYFCNQITASDDTENPPEYRDGGFVSIYFASDGTNRDHAGRSTFTMVGNYICGGKYDDGLGGKLDETSGTGVAPDKMITYMDRLFIEAELAAAGVAGVGSERAKLDAAIDAAFAKVDEVATASAAGAPVLFGTPEADGYKADILSLFDIADAEGKMSIIMTEKWVSTFGKGIDQYTDYRRTGYPVLFDPETMPSDGGPDGSGDVPTSLNREMQLSLAWKQGELDLNPNSPAQKASTDVRVFWDIN